MITRLVVLLVLSLSAVIAHPFVMIDSFDVGPYHQEFTGEGHDASNQMDLPLSDVAFGERATYWDVDGNPDAVRVSLDIAEGGEALVRGRAGASRNLATRLRFDYGSVTDRTIDLAAETEFWIDEYTKTPDNRFADIWSIFARDVHGTSATNTGWLSRGGGIYFRKNGFTRQIDWSKVELISLQTEFTPSIGPHPEVYSLQRFYTVPEPSTLLFGLSSVFLARFVRARNTDPSHRN